MDMARAAIAIAVSALLAAPLEAQDRMPPIPADKLTDAQKKAAETFAEGRGYQVRGPFVPLIRSPEVMLRAKAMGDYLRFKSVLEPRINEMVIITTAREWTQQFEWQAHSPAALKACLRPDTADAMAHGRPPTGFAEDQEIAYDMATEILRLKRVSDTHTPAPQIRRAGRDRSSGRGRLLQFPHRRERHADCATAEPAGAAAAIQMRARKA